MLECCVNPHFCLFEVVAVVFQLVLKMRFVFVIFFFCFVCGRVQVNIYSFNHILKTLHKVTVVNTLTFHQNI